MKIALVDDDIQACDHLRACLDSLLGPSCALTCYASGEAFLAAWQPGLFDLVVLDIFMAGMSGVEVARAVRATDKAVKLVFCSSSNEFASESYEVNARDYLRKPFSRERVAAMLDRLELTELERSRSLTLPNGVSVVLRNISYVDFSAHRVVLHSRQGGTTVVRVPFSQMESLLCAYPYFFCPTKGMIVNFYEVAAQNGNAFALRDGTIVPISRRKAKEALDAYSAFLFRQLRKEGDAACRRCTD